MGKMRVSLLAAMLVGETALPGLSAEIGPFGQINMYVVSQPGARCVLARADKIIEQTRITISQGPPSILGESEPFYIDTDKNHEPITVTCFAPGFKTSSVTVEYVHHGGSVFVVCVFSDHMTDQERQTAEACQRRISGKTILADWWGYPESVVINLTHAK